MDESREATKLVKRLKMQFEAEENTFLYLETIRAIIDTLEQLAWMIDSLENRKAECDLDL